MDAVEPGGLGGTYAGNPVACAAALAVLDVIAAAAAPQQGLILLTCGVHGNTIRLLFPLVISDTLFAEALDMQEMSLTARDY